MAAPARPSSGSAPEFTLSPAVAEIVAGFIEQGIEKFNTDHTDQTVIEQAIVRAARRSAIEVRGLHASVA